MVRLAPVAAVAVGERGCERKWCFNYASQKLSHYNT